MSAVLLTAVALAAGPAVAQVSGAYTVEPLTPSSQITIQGAGVRLRAEPFTTPQTQVLSSGSTGLPLTVVGIARLPDWNWYQVVLKNGQKAFIRSDYTSAPSKGGVAAQPLPVGSSPTAPPVANLPAPIPVNPNPTYSAPAVPAAPISALPAWTPGGTPAAPADSNAPISLVPVTPFEELPVETPPPASDGLTSVDPVLAPR